MSFPRYERYKDSGVDWLGDVPEHWEVVPLKHLADFINGDAFKPTEWAESGTPIIRIQNLNGGEEFNYYEGEVEPRYLVHDGDLLFGWSGNRGTSFGPFLWRRKEVCALNQHIFRVVPATLSTQSFYWTLKAVTARVEDQAHGIIGMVHITKGDLGAINVPIPPEEEHRKLATFLDQETAKIDALVEEQQRLIELLKEKRQSLISGTITKGLTPNIPLKFSGSDWLGRVPSHWQVERAGHLFIERDERSELGDEEMLTVSHLTGVTPRSEKTVNMFEAETTEGYKRVYPGDLVINTLWAWMGAMGVSSYSGIVSPAYHVYRARPTLESDYINALVRISAFAKEVSRWSKGVWSSRLRLYPQEMFQILFPVPPLEEQRRISEGIREQDAKMTELIQESEIGMTLLQERRTSLISAAVTGKIDVRAYMAKPVMSATQYSSGFAHQLLAAEILDRCNSPRMGRIKLQKLIHLCEYHGQVSEVQGDYSRKAAGPFDAKAMAGVRNGLKKQKWFEEVKDGERYIYKPLAKRGEHKKYLAHWETEMPRITEVLNLLGNAKTRQCEIVSTLYAAWNALLIDKQAIDDATILHEASSAKRWHKSKEKIEPEIWKSALQWMKDKGLVPVGYGKHTRHNAESIEGTAEVANEPA
jgi:type I restriction enzyme S subunit